MSRVQVLRELYQNVEDKVLPLLSFVSTKEGKRAIEVDYIRMDNEPVSLPYIIDLRKVVSTIKGQVSLVGMDMEDEKRAAMKALRELDLVLLAFQQFLNRGS